MGICGQGPSDYPDFAQFLVEEGIDTISVTPDSFFKTVIAINSIENGEKVHVEVKDVATKIDGIVRKEPINQVLKHSA